MKAPSRIAAAIVFIVAAGCSERSDRPASVVVTTTMLQSIAADLLAGTDVDVVTILPPGSCPGHFDLKPSVLGSLRSASLILRHDFQGALEERIRSVGAQKAETLSLKTPGSLLVPANYIALAEDVAEALARSMPNRADAIGNSLNSLRQRVTRFEGVTIDSDLPWKGSTAILSGHQMEFGVWLGLVPVGSLKRPEDTTPAELERLLSAEAAVIVANLQEGPQAAEALGARKGLPVAVFSNFPGVEGYGLTYEDVVTENIRRLRRAWESR